MFTGLIEDVGSIRKFERSAAAGRLTVATSLPVEGIALGDSVAVNGACLTVVARQAGQLTFDVSPETLASSTLGQLGPGAAVNLEQALRLGDRLGGHWVTGHVDCLGEIVERRSLDGNTVIRVRLPRENCRYVVEKGSVALDGISLTVNAVDGETFSVNVIPHTAVMTTLHNGKVGMRVNIETDILGKYVERLLTGDRQPAAAGRITLDLLAKNGFL
ncbi:riboflavin synthase subunit alpha [Geotalea uraniireducens]|uniref:Riboflavin synthase n=1 Tax=Geotalea uraniireducens TaxID=351604 RepID=A0ABM8ELI0_9BACT|nr:riboflavin synthase [Geotalea uraniireducens]BDV43297.1 riboflavin synthase subunit alpha [Geotalea uraniireducens]